jgi:predicted transcriptional regulator
MPRSVTIELDDEAAQTLDRIAVNTGRSCDRLLAQAVHDYLTLLGWQRNKIAAGIEAADLGDFASEDELVRIEEKYVAPV